MCTNLNVESLVNLLDVIRYHIKSEKSGRAPFKIDNKKILDALKEHVEKNKGHFASKKISKTDDTNFVEYFEEINEEMIRYNRDNLKEFKIRKLYTTYVNLPYVKYNGEMWGNGMQG